MSFNKNNSINDLKVNLKHKLDMDNIKYHNNNIYISGFNSKEIKNNSEAKIQQNLNDISVDYSDIVEILDLELDEIIIINMKSYWEQNDMSPLQRKLLNQNINSIVTINQYKYRICKIIKA